MIGEKLGSYTLLEIVGNGSLGTVYRAEDPKGRLVALKLVRSQVLSTLERREQFLRFALAASEIRDPRVCPILEIGDDSDDFFIIMPLISGKTLEQHMEKKPIPWPRALAIALAVGSAIEAVHNAGAIHRGLRPANIWILDSQGPSVMLSDCGTGHYTETCKRERGESLNFGSYTVDAPACLDALAYMSPEQIRGEPLDCRSDLFSFGVILYEMVNGRHPFRTHNSISYARAILEANASAIISNPTAIQRRLEPILLKALAKDPQERYQNMRMMLTELRAARDSLLCPPAEVKVPMGIRKWISAKFRCCLRT
jgi:serine/threonine protein kinase